MIIGVAGFAGSGKGTVADVLVESYGFRKMSFADSVKDAVSAIFGWPRHLLEGDTNESREFRECADQWWSDKLGYEMKPRLALQMMGTEAGRDVFHKDLWIHSINNKLRLSENKDIVIPDVRFPNEMQAIRDVGGFIVRVRRGKEPVWYDAAKIANMDNNFSLMEKYNVHFSEWAWIGSRFDYEINNDGSVEYLKAEISHLTKVFTGPRKPDSITLTRSHTH